MPRYNKNETLCHGTKLRYLSMATFPSALSGLRFDNTLGALYVGAPRQARWFIPAL